MDKTGKHQKLLNTARGIYLTPEEKYTLDWLSGCEDATVENICNIILKVKRTPSVSEQTERLLAFIRSNQRPQYESAKKQASIFTEKQETRIRAIIYEETMNCYKVSKHIENTKEQRQARNGKALREMFLTIGNEILQSEE